MAYTKIHPIVATVGVAVDYICNEKKTKDVHGNGDQLVTCIGTSKQTAKYDFKFDLSKTRQSKKQNHLAYHIVQSFDPSDGISFEEAHKIAQEFCEQYLKGKYRCVIATHRDKEHVHNHIIFCAADSIEHKKFHDDKSNIYKIRNLSDKLCKQHGLSIITQQSGRKGKSHYEWEQNQKGSSWKFLMETDIKDAIKNAHSYEEFLQIMSGKGYEYKGEKIGENEPKFLAFKSTIQDQNGECQEKKFIRVSEKNFGRGMTKEKIKERIANKEKWLADNRQNRKEKVQFPADYSKQQIIDTSADKYVDSQGLKMWATRQNMKAVQAIINKYGSIAQMQKTLTENSAAIVTGNTKISANEKQMRELTDVIRYAEQYKENEVYNYRYKKSPNPDKYMREHEPQLLLYAHAVQNLKKRKYKPEETDPDDLKNKLTDLEIECDDLRAEIKELQADNKQLKHDLEKLKEYGLIQETIMQPEAEQKKNQNKQL